MQLNIEKFKINSHIKKVQSSKFSLLVGITNIKKMQIRTHQSLEIRQEFQKHSVFNFITFNSQYNLSFDTSKQ